MLSLCVIVKFPRFPIHKISITLLLLLYQYVMDGAMPIHLQIYIEI